MKNNALIKAALGFFLIMAVLSFFFYLSDARRRSVHEDYYRLASEGDVLEGEILSLKPFRRVFNSRFRVSGAEGIAVEIAYFYDGVENRFKEDWPFENEGALREKTGDSIPVYIHSGNRYVRAATEKNPDLAGRIFAIKQRDLNDRTRNLSDREKRAGILTYSE